VSRIENKTRKNSLKNQKWNEKYFLTGKGETE
jgi:hypothetical protein